MKRELCIEDLRFTPPQLSPSDVLSGLRQSWGLEGTLTPLAGERDQNFRLSASDGNSYLLKIASPLEAQVLIDFQVAALQHIESRVLELSVPRMIAARDGRVIQSHADFRGVEHSMRVLSWVEGAPLTALPAYSDELLISWGLAQGQVAAALDGFSHPGADHFMPWDILNELVFSPALRAYLPDYLESSLSSRLEYLREQAMPRLLQLPAQVIHNDGHSGNVLFDADNENAVVGLIDFGDMVRRPLVVDVAVAMTSIAELRADLASAAGHFLDGYQQAVSLGPEQLGLIYDAITLRSVLTVQLLSFRAAHAAAGAEKILAEDLPSAMACLENVLSQDRHAFNRSIGVLD